MIAMKKILFSVVLCLLFAGCKQERLSGVFCDNHYVFEQFEDSAELKGELFLSESQNFGVEGILGLKDYLVFKFPERENLMSVYDKQGNHLKDFARKGRARNEFHGVTFTGQYTGNKFVVNDINSSALKIVDLNKVLAGESDFVEKSFFTGGRCINAFCLSDPDVVYEQEIQDNFRLKIVDSRADTVKQQMDLYQPQPDAFRYYFSKTCIHPANTKLCFGMVRMNQINFLSLETMEKKSVSMYRDAEKQKEEIPEAWLYYGDVAADKDRVYALYLNQSTEDTFEVPMPREIHVFDWDGNPVKKLKVKEDIMYMWLDASSGYLYGADSKDEFYRYKL